MDEDFKKLCAIIADVLGIDPDEITMDTTFDEDLGADSLDVASIIMGIEDEYDVKVDTEVASKVTTVGEALALSKGAAEALEILLLASWKDVSAINSKTGIFLNVR